MKTCIQKDYCAAAPEPNIWVGKIPGRGCSSCPNFRRKLCLKKNYAYSSHINLKMSHARSCIYTQRKREAGKSFKNLNIPTPSSTRIKYLPGNSVFPCMPVEVSSLILGLLLYTHVKLSSPSYFSLHYFLLSSLSPIILEKGEIYGDIFLIQTF